MLCISQNEKQLSQPAQMFTSRARSLDCNHNAEQTINSLWCSIVDGNNYSSERAMAYVNGANFELRKTMWRARDRSTERHRETQRGIERHGEKQRYIYRERERGSTARWCMHGWQASERNVYGRLFWSLSISLVDHSIYVYTIHSFNLYCFFIWCGSS